MRRFGYYVELPRSTIKAIKRRAKAATKEKGRKVCDWEVLHATFKK